MGSVAAQRSWLDPEAAEAATAPAALPETEQVAGRLLQPGQQILFAGAVHIIRSVDRRTPDTWWLLTGRIEIGLIRDRIELPISPGKTYSRVVMAMSEPAAPDGTERRADLVWPGDRLRRGGAVLQAETVAVSAALRDMAATVEIFARPVGGGAPCRLAVPADELLRVVR